MKTKNIYEIALKIGGIVAAWKVIESLILFGIMIVTFSSMPTFGAMNLFGISPINNMSIYLIFAYALFAFLLLFRTEKIMELLKLNNPDDAKLHIERKVFYHILILACGFTLFFYSANHIVTKTYSSSENTTTNYTEHPTSKTTHINSTTSPININVSSNSYSSSSTTTSSSNSSTKSTTTSNTTNTSYNYISMLLVLLSLVIIFKSVKISDILLSKLEYDDVVV